MGSLCFFSFFFFFFCFFSFFSSPPFLRSRLVAARAPAAPLPLTHLHHSVQAGLALGGADPAASEGLVRASGVKKPQPCHRRKMETQKNRKKKKKNGKKNSKQK